MTTSKKPAPSVASAATEKRATAFRDELLRLEAQRHGLSAYRGERLEQKAEHLATFVDQAIANGLTVEMVSENLAAGRPAIFVETGE